MIVRSLIVAAGLAAAAIATPAFAQSTGLDGLHEKVRVGGKLCFVDHFHSGSSNSEATRKAAEVAAIRVWSNFTAWEYGAAWGRWQNAASKTMNCSQSNGSWGCTINARPCRGR